MRKIIALTLALLMICLPLLASCNEGGNDSSAAVSDSAATSADASDAGSDESQTNETSDGWADGIVGYLGNGVWGREMPEFVWDRDTFSVLVYNNNIQTTYYSEEIEPNLYDTTDAIISEAVASRNNIIYDRYGVEIKAVLCDNVATTLIEQITTGGPDCADAAMPFLNSCTTLAQNGQLYDLREFEEGGYIDLSMPWWEENATESFSVANKVYFAVGEMSIMQKIVSSAVMYNKDLLAQKYPDMNMYEEVKNKTWTIDKMISISKEFTYESDNVDGLTWLDTWGYGGTQSNIISFYSASGKKLVSKDSDDLPMLSFGTVEADLVLAQSMLEMLTEKNTWVINAEDMGTDIWTKCVQIFGEGRNLFRSTAFSAVKKVRVYDVNFGLIPYPLMSEEQDEYYTPCSAMYAYGSVIPLSAPDPEFSAFMLDAMCAVSKGENSAGLTRAYIEVVLKGKDLQADEEACEILDKYIFNNIIYDLGIIYSFGIDDLLTGMVKNGSTDIVSQLDANRDSIEAKIEQLIDTYNDR